MSTVLYILAGLGFIISACAHLYVKLRLQPGKDSDLDDYYYEFEDQHPGLARYNKWSRITFGAMVVSVLLLFVAAAI